MEKQPWEIDRTLENVAGDPFLFELKDGTKLGLGEWTIGAEKWAKKHFETVERMFNILMGEEGDGSDTVDVAVKIAIYKLTPESRQVVEDKIQELNDPNINTMQSFFEEFITYKNLAGLCKAEFDMIRTSIPIDAIEDIKKKHGKKLTALMNQETKGTKASRKTVKTNGKKKRPRK